MMKRLVTVCAIVAMFLCTYANADMTINFDDISTGSAGWADVPSNYKGLTWGGDWEVMSQTYYNNTYGGGLTFPSSPNAAYNGDSTVNLLSISSGTQFTLDSLDASAFGGSWGWRSLTLKVTGYLGGSEVGNDTLNLSVGFVQWAPDLGGLVDKVDFAGESLTRYAYLVDNVTITPVPLPAAVLLGILGLGAAGLKLRKYA